MKRLRKPTTRQFQRMEEHLHHQGGDQDGEPSARSSRKDRYGPDYVPAVRDMYCYAIDSTKL